MGIVIREDLIPHDTTEPDGPAPECVDIGAFFDAHGRYTGADCYGIAIMDAGRMPPRVLMAGDQIAADLTSLQVAELRYCNAQEDERFAKSMSRDAELNLDNARDLYRSLSWSRHGEYQDPAALMDDHRRKVADAYLQYENALALAEDARYLRDRRVDEYTAERKEAQSCPP